METAAALQSHREEEEEMEEATASRAATNVVRSLSLLLKINNRENKSAAPHSGQLQSVASHIRRPRNTFLHLRGRRVGESDSEKHDRPFAVVNALFADLVLISEDKICINYQTEGSLTFILFPSARSAFSYQTGFDTGANILIILNVEGE